MIANSQQRRRSTFETNILKFFFSKGHLLLIFVVLQIKIIHIYLSMSRMIDRVFYNPVENYSRGHPLYPSENLSYCQVLTVSIFSSTNYVRYFTWSFLFLLKIMIGGRDGKHASVRNTSLALFVKLCLPSRLSKLSKLVFHPNAALSQWSFLFLLVCTSTCMFSYFFCRGKSVLQLYN